MSIRTFFMKLFSRTKTTESFILCGLGNPGEKYESSFHNVAWMLMDAMYPDATWQKNRYMNGLSAHTDISFSDSDNSAPLVLVRPTTFMNRSGDIIPYLHKTYQVSPDHFIVMHDDVDLPLGTFRIAYNRGDAGHKGVASLVHALKTRSFVRIRIGVHTRHGDDRIIKPDVLKSLSNAERASLLSLAEPVRDAVACIMEHGVSRAMHVYHTSS